MILFLLGIRDGFDVSFPRVNPVLISLRYLIQVVMRQRKEWMTRCINPKNLSFWLGRWDSQASPFMILSQANPRKKETNQFTEQYEREGFEPSIVLCFELNQISRPEQFIQTHMKGKALK